nr:hypothetical protein [Serratia quinivorans]
MEIIRVTHLLPLLTLAACQGKSLPGTTAHSDVPKEWWFNFFKPKALSPLLRMLMVRFMSLIPSTAQKHLVAGNQPIEPWNIFPRSFGAWWSIFSLDVQYFQFSKRSTGRRTPSPPPHGAIGSSSASGPSSTATAYAEPLKLF